MKKYFLQKYESPRNRIICRQSFLSRNSAFDRVKEIAYTSIVSVKALM